MVFQNRDEAAQLLVRRLRDYKGRDPYIAAIPRGAVPMAKVIADELEGELGIVLVHKIPAPFTEELAIGSVGLSGQVQLGPYVEVLKVSEAYLAEAVERQKATLEQRRRIYGLSPTGPQLKGRVAIIVDDGIATGATVLAAIEEMRIWGASEIVVAAAVAPLQTVRMLAERVDQIVLLDQPAEFYAVGQFFQDFPQVSDDEVIAILEASRKERWQASAREHASTPSTMTE